ncbi:MAG TPA: chromosome segregation protein SMC [Desulfobacteraceae bacterium]|nr:chromosome segregation protein SMC [Desulfobacteraceae bacterium]
MRFDRLDLLAYGPFTDTILDLSDGSSGLHLIYGNNEAGKSTSLRALIGWLFGIPVRTGDNFIHSNPHLRIGGRLRLSNGRVLDFIRRKGKKGTLLDPDTGETLDDSVLEPFLSGGIDENLFTKLYGIDHARLVEGGQELLNQSGDLGQALFSAATGTASLRRILSELRSGADTLFKPKASTKFVNQAISGFKDAKRRIKEASLPVAEWKRLRKELAETVNAIEEVEGEIRNKSKEKSRLDRFNRVKGALAERRALMERIDALGEVLFLPEDLGEKFKFACSNLQTFRDVKAKAESRLARLREESEKLNVRTELVDNEEVILAFYKEIGGVEKAIQDRPKQDAKRRLLRSEAEQLLKAVRPDLTLEDADLLRPLTSNKKWIADLARRHSLLKQKRENTENALRDFEEDQSAIRKELGGQAESSLDPGELKAAVATARKAGDLEQRLADAKKRAAQDDEACKNEFSRLGRFYGSVDELLKTPMPVPETLDTFEKKFDELSEKAKDLDRIKSELSEELKGTEQDLNALLLKSDAPTIIELEDVRRVRNTGWDLIKRKYIQKSDAESEIALYTQGFPLPEVYEQKVGEADHISDQLRVASDQVVKRADLEARKKDLKSRLEAVADETGRVEARRIDLEKEWKEVWEQLDIEPGLPREMKQWLLRVEQLLSNVRSARLVSAESRNLSAQCNALRETIAVQLSRFDETIDPGGMSLEAMISLCEQRIEQEDGALEKKRRLEHSLNDLSIRIKKAREDLASIENDWAGWSEEWAEAIADLGLKGDAHPERVTEVFEQLLVFFDKFDKSEDSRRRIYGIDQVSEQFKEKVSAFAESIGYEATDHKAAALAAQLNRELAEAREARASLLKIEAQEKETRAEIEEAELTIQAACRQIAALRDQACVKTDDELEAAWERSKTMRELRQRLETVERELTRNGDGLGIRELELEAEELDADAIGQELARVSAELEELQTNRDKLRDQRQVVQNEIQAKDGSDTAAVASEEAEQHLADMVSGIEQYLRLEIAALILEQRIEEYRRKNQAPVLARAGQLFAKLTLGSFANLRDELNENGMPVLLGVRPNELEVTVDQMSDGTRDQLYLALRLATLEQHLQKGEPMPFVVDDILIGFDDNRTSVCLEVLAEIALSTQVLVFTHHRRVVELTEELEAQAGVYTHSLNS